jgi:hypothetical protein
MRVITSAIDCALLLSGSASALAQTTPAPKAVAKTTKPAAPKAAPKATPSPIVMPDPEKIVLLLRTTLLTLNDAVQTGNFTVLRDVAAPGFRDANTAGRLAQSFSDLATKGVDLSPVSVIAPQLTEAPGLDQQKGMLHLKGYFPGQPVQINFEMLYQAVNGRWRRFGLSVQPAPPAPQPQAAQSQAAQPQAAQPQAAQSQATPPAAQNAPAPGAANQQ